jgi:hypothetical protein
VPAIGPDVAGTLQEPDSGSTVCLHVGEQLNVFLHVASGSQTDRWQPIRSSNTPVLEAQANGALTLPRGVTAGVFRAVATGTSRLTSSRAPCGGGAGSGCDSSTAWSVTVEVLTA